jgi:hypothetical protein
MAVMHRLPNRKSTELYTRLLAAIFEPGAEQPWITPWAGSKNPLTRKYSRKLFII